MSLRSSLLLLGMLTLLPLRSSHADQQIMSQDEMDRIASIEDLHAADGTVTARLVNHTDASLENVQVAVSYVFLWNDEFHPGSDDPGRTDSFTLSAPVPPHGTVPLRLSGAPLPARADGHFMPMPRIESLVRRQTVPAGSSGY